MQVHPLVVITQHRPPNYMQWNVSAALEYKTVPSIEYFPISTYIGMISKCGDGDYQSRRARELAPSISQSRHPSKHVYTRSKRCRSCGKQTRLIEYCRKCSDLIRYTRVRNKYSISVFIVDDHLVICADIIIVLRFRLIRYNWTRLGVIVPKNVCSMCDHVFTERFGSRSYGTIFCTCGVCGRKLWLIRDDAIRKLTALRKISTNVDIYSYMRWFLLYVLMHTYGRMWRPGGRLVRAPIDI